MNAMDRFYAKYTPIAPDLNRREDTRAYLLRGAQDQSQRDCVGTIWMQNPGSAEGTSDWGPLRSLDPALRVVDQILDVVVDRAPKMGKSIGAGEYLQILSLHYVCGTYPDSAWERGGALSKYSEAVSKTSRFSWLAWGADIRHGLLLRNAALIASIPTTVFSYEFASHTIRRGFRLMEHPSHPLKGAGLGARSMIADEMLRHL